jgi:hypothetical protein
MKAASDFLSKTSSFIILRKHPIGDEPLGISLKELIDITKENSSHVHLLMTYSEQYQIIHPKFMETFRYALGNYSHLFGKLSSKHFTSANQVYSLPCAEEAHDLMLDAHCHIFDLQKGLQTIAFGDVFDTELVDRAPANPEFRVLSLDVGKLDSFHEYLLHDSPWGKEATKSEESAKRFFNQGRD